MTTNAAALPHRRYEGHYLTRLKRTKLKAIGLTLRLPALLFSVILFCGTGPARADEPSTQPLPNTAPLQAELLYSGFSDISEITFTPHLPEKLFIVERRGRIRVLEDNELLDNDLLDIEENLSSDPGVGLQSLALPPTSTPTFFITYTDKNGDTILASVTPPTDEESEASLADASVILKIVQPQREHQRSVIRFGLDGYLYMAVGSREPLTETQQQESLKGGILRLDVSDPLKYKIPSDNPTTNTPPQPHEMWARGITNAWSLLFDTKSNDALIGLTARNGEQALYVLEKGRDYSKPCSRSSCTNLLATPEGSTKYSFIGAVRYNRETGHALNKHLLLADQTSGSIVALDTATTPPKKPLPISTISKDQVKAIATSPSGEVFVATDKEVFKLKNPTS